LERKRRKGHWEGLVQRVKKVDKIRIAYEFPVRGEKRKVVEAPEKILLEGKKPKAEEGSTEVLGRR
jgi:hypothetical protein